MTNGDDTSHGYFQRSKGAAFEKLASEKTVFEPKPLPQSFAPSLILQNMLNTYKSGDTGVVIVYAESGLGKSVSARLVFNKASRGIMFGGKPRTDGIYWKLVAGQLQVPKYHDFKHLHSWVDVLFQKTARTEEQCAWRIPSLTCVGREETTDLPLPIEFEEPLPKRPIIVFDDFDEVLQEDINFMKVIFLKADDYDILVIVLTADALTANKLCKLNHWRRVAPMEGSFNAGAKRRLSDGKFNDPVWIPMAWEKRQLERLLQCHGFTAMEIRALDVQAEENPYDLLKRARRRRNLDSETHSR